MEDLVIKFKVANVNIVEYAAQRSYETPFIGTALIKMFWTEMHM